jgi:hypothetical protein
MIGFSIITPVAFKHLKPKTLCQIAFFGVILSGGTLWLSSAAEHILISFYLGMALLGAAMGILASQCPVIITNALGERDAEQSGGLQATLRNIGLVIGISLFGGINQWGLESEISSNSDVVAQFPIEFLTRIDELSHIPYIDNARLESSLEVFDFNNVQTHNLIAINANARLKGFDLTMITLIMTALLGFIVSSRLNCHDDKPITLVPKKASS